MTSDPDRAPLTRQFSCLHGTPPDTWCRLGCDRDDEPIGVTGRLAAIKASIELTSIAVADGADCGEVVWASIEDDFAWLLAEVERLNDVVRRCDTEIEAHISDLMEARAEVGRLTAAIRTIADTDPGSMRLMDVAQALGDCRRTAWAVLDQHTPKEGCAR